MQEGQQPNPNPDPNPAPQPKPCRHEYVRIFQRRLKGLDRRLVSTRAYLPTGFKIGDFGHLSEGSFCFCVTCRGRLFPKRTQADKLQARLLAREGKAALTEESQDLLDEVGAERLLEVLGEGEIEDSDDDTSRLDIHVEELVAEGVDVQDIEAEGVKLNEEEDNGDLPEEEQ